MVLSILALTTRPTFSCRILRASPLPPAWPFSVFACSAIALFLSARAQLLLPQRRFHPRQVFLHFSQLAQTLALPCRRLKPQAEQLLGHVALLAAQLIRGQFIEFLFLH